MEMQVEERNIFRRMDLNLIVVILALQFIGLINLYSATHGLRSTATNNLFYQQIMWIFVGWGIFLSLTLANYSFFFRSAYLFYGINLSFLFLVDMIGTTTAGVQRWLDLGFFRYQPSETMKLFLVLAMGRYLAQRHFPNGMSLREMIVPMMVIGVPFLMIAKQPDLGSAAILAAIGMTMLLFVRVQTKLLVSAGIVALIAAPLVWKYGLKDYQRDRVLTFISPGSDPRGAGYHSIQSRIAVGSGKVFGKGFRKGTQSQLEFLPERHTDFIFSVLGEEYGFIGSLTTIILFSVLMFMCVRIGHQARDKFGALVAVGVTLFLFFHVFVNVGMVIGLLPVKGSPLPLFSYGGSNMMATMAALGLLSSVSCRKFMF